jgi:G:T-mismatch repair DNA endonuclease (very short patch repair protein)
MRGHPSIVPKCCGHFRPGAVVPAPRTELWQTKRSGNVARDEKAEALLNEQGLAGLCHYRRRPISGASVGQEASVIAGVASHGKRATSRATLVPKSGS